MQIEGKLQFQLIKFNNLLYAFHPDGTWQSEDAEFG